VTLNLRPEVREHLRMAERLIGFARQKGELSDDECALLMYYVKEIEREIAPLCPNHCERPASE
jgi:hypothetical protein